MQIQEFDPTRISKSSSNYDVKKLNWFNAQYIKKLDEEKYMSLVKPFLEEAYDLKDKDEKWITHLAKIYQNHISFGKEIVKEVEMFFNEETNPSEECIEFMKEEGIDKTLNCFKNEIENISSWSVEEINNAINNTKGKAEVKGKMLYMPIRIKTTGVMHGPELPDTIYLLGKELTLKRLSN